jgi:hypothetical protein
MVGARRVFRVFVSSTFQDLKAERDALQERVFPKLRDHCAESGYSFQPIDLRWGIGDEASAGQRTMRICLDEIARCQATTPRPNFLLLLGDRYGWRPLPEEVPRKEFETVKSYLDSKGRDLAGDWYKLDANALPDEKPPGVYRLQPRGADREEAWDEAQEVLAPALRKAAEAAKLTPDALVKYTASATEQEILAGALKDKVEAKSVFAFVRTIEGLPVAREASDYRDLMSDVEDDAEATDWKIDTEAEDRLADLKQRLRDRLGEDNTKSYSATWVGSRSSADEEAGPSTGHLGQLCEDVYSLLKGVIDAEISRLGKGETTTQAEEEAAHEAFREERGSSFTGREEYLTAIARYLGAPASHPLLIWGYGGSGKSALLAKTIEDARGAHPEATIVHRFIGATPKSTDIRSLLQDLFEGIGAAYHLEGEMPSDFNELVRAFRERLEAAGAKRPLLLFLDSLDQLSTSYGAQDFTWLPTALPDGVWLVTSIRPEEEEDEVTGAGAAEATDLGAMRGPLGTLQRMLPEGALLQLGPMGVSDAEKLLAKWLALAKRRLTEKQRAVILGSFGRSGLPLHLRLAFGTARTWSSYDAPEGIRDTVRDMVAALYERLEYEHGPVLVGHTLAYLAATRNMMGLAEDEILDILPEDGAVFEEFKSRSKHRVAEGRIPVITWSRLFFDLQPYLGTRSSEGVTLLAFYHRELGEVATKRYLEGNRAERHATLAALFEGIADPTGDHRWTGTARRAFSELPYHLVASGDMQAVGRAVQTGLAEREAVVRGEANALGTARTFACALAATGDEHWDDLVRCARAYASINSEL